MDSGVRTSGAGWVFDTTTRPGQPQSLIDRMTAEAQAARDATPYNTWTMGSKSGRVQDWDAFILRAETWAGVIWDAARWAAIVGKQRKGTK